MTKRSKNGPRDASRQDAGGPPPGYLPRAHPPRPNRVLFVATGVLLAAWLVTLAWLSWQ